MRLVQKLKLGKPGFWCLFVATAAVIVFLNFNLPRHVAPGSSRYIGRHQLPILMPREAHEGSDMVRHLEQNTGLIVDVGTSHNAFDLVTLLKDHPKWTGLGFEAVPSNCDSAQIAVQQFGDRSKVICKAMSNEKGVAQVHVGANDPGTSSLNKDSTDFTDGTEQTIEVPTSTLSDEIHEDVLLLKIDAQGWEQHILHGAERLVSQHLVSYIFCEFDPFYLGHANAEAPRTGINSSPETLLKWFRDHDFSCVSSQTVHCYSSRVQATTAFGYCALDLACAHTKVARVSSITWEQDILALLMALNRQPPYVMTVV